MPLKNKLLFKQFFKIFWDVMIVDLKNKMEHLKEAASPKEFQDCALALHLEELVGEKRMAGIAKLLSDIKKDIRSVKKYLFLMYKAIAFSPKDQDQVISEAKKDFSVFTRERKKKFKHLKTIKVRWKTLSISRIKDEVSSSLQENTKNVLWDPSPDNPQMANCKVNINMRDTLIPPQERKQFAVTLDEHQKEEIRKEQRSFHVRSNCKGSSAYSSAFANCRHIFDLGADFGYHMDFLDIGGGFPGFKGPYASFEKIADVVSESLEEHFPPECGVRVIAESGRFFVASPFTLCANIIAKGETVTEKDVPICIYYLNDGVYGSFNCLIFDHAEVEPVPLVDTKYRYMLKSSIWGPTCDSIDCIFKSCHLPSMAVGELLMFENMGAYTICVASTFNSFQKPEMKSILPVHILLTRGICNIDNKITEIYNQPILLQVFLYILFNHLWNRLLMYLNLKEKVSNAFIALKPTCFTDKKALPRFTVGPFRRELDSSLRDKMCMKMNDSKVGCHPLSKKLLGLMLK